MFFLMEVSPLMDQKWQEIRVKNPYLFPNSGNFLLNYKTNIFIFNIYIVFDINLGKSIPDKLSQRF